MTGYSAVSVTHSVFFCPTLKQLIVPHVEIISLDAYRLIMFLHNVLVRRLKRSEWKHFSVHCSSVIGKIIALFDGSEDSFPCTCHKSNTKVMMSTQNWRNLPWETDVLGKKWVNK